jgi:hypothetical protein
MASMADSQRMTLGRGKGGTEKKHPSTTVTEPRKPTKK